MGGSEEGRGKGRGCFPEDGRREAISRENVGHRGRKGQRVLSAEGKGKKNPVVSSNLSLAGEAEKVRFGGKFWISRPQRGWESETLFDGSYPGERGGGHLKNLRRWDN